jgi:hypothetical protein
MKSAARLAVLLFAATAVGCDSPRQQLDSHELALAAKSLASLSAEAELLVRQLGSGTVTVNFALVHQDALAQETLKLAKQLAKPVPDDLRSTHQRELAINGRLQSGLGQIATAPAQPARLARLEQRFHALRADARALEQQP